MDIFFRKERKVKKKKHTPGDYKVLFSCVRVQKRVERLNPKRQKQKIFYLRKTKRKKKKSKRNQEHQTHTRSHAHIQNGMRTKRKFFFGFF
jgi:hypothetical protein